MSYLRVSTEEQASSGLGLDAQRSSIRRAARERGWSMVGEFADPGVSGRIRNRPGLEAALEAVSAGCASGLVVAKLDRLSRSLLDFAELMERSRRERWTLVALDLGIDTASPQGELMAAVLATFAQFEARLGSERTKSALAQKKAAGERLGRPLAIEPAVMTRINELRAKGVSYRAIADQLNDEGVPGAHGGRWHATTILRAIRARSG